MGHATTAESLFTRNLRELARYNRRANARLYDRCAELPDEALCEATGAALGNVLARCTRIPCTARTSGLSGLGRGGVPHGTAA